MWLPDTCNAGVLPKQDTSGALLKTVYVLTPRAALERIVMNCGNQTGFISLKKRLNQVTRDKSHITQRQVKRKVSKKIYMCTKP